MANQIPFARGKSDVVLNGKMANRHGLIAGATGTGKSVTLRVLAEGFSRIGTSVFLADVKGDLASIAFPGSPTEVVSNRAKLLGLGEIPFEGVPVRLWDVFGERGHHARATISEIGPLLLSRLFELNDTQSDVLSLVFRIADDMGLLLLDLKDLKAMLQFTGENASQFQSEYGNIAPATIGAIQRRLTALEQQGAASLFGEPALRISDLTSVDLTGKGIVNVLVADKLMQTPRTYSTFLLFLLSELYETLPEAGDLEKPKLVFFFDEAHLLFNDAPKALLEKIEMVVRLIRSKGVGVYFISQSPLDIPDDVLGQLGNRVQHALRAFTPRDQKMVRVAAQTFRADGTFNVEETLTQLEVGEALVSVLDVKGAPAVVERAMIYPPHSRLGTISVEEQSQIVSQSPLLGYYKNAIDRESAYEKLRARTTEAEVPESHRPSTRAPESPDDTPRASGRSRQTLLEAFMSSTARAIGSSLGRQILRGVMGSIAGNSRRRY